MFLITYIILSTIIIIALLLILTSYYFFNMAVLRSDKNFLVNNNDLNFNDTRKQFDSDNRWIINQLRENIELESYDGLILHGYYLPARTTTDKTVILAHGYASNGMELGGLAKFYYEVLGFNVLIPDNRAHGLSEGKYIGFGWLDRKDYLGWMDYAIIKNGINSEIILHGISMGAATVLMVSGEVLTKNIKCIISDCAYTSAHDILAYQLRRMYNLPAIPLIQITSLICKLKAGYYFEEASCVKQVSKTKTPVLFIHGGKDVFVPIDMFHTLYEKCNSEKEKMIVPKASHANSYHTDTLGYQKKVIHFINKYLNFE